MDYFLVIRFFGLLIVSLYTYWRILGLNLIKSKTIAVIIFSIVMSIPLSLVPPLYELLFLVSVGIFVSIITRVKLSLLIPTVIIAVGISLGMDRLAASISFLATIIFEIIYFVTVGTALFDIVTPNALDTLSAITQSTVFILTIVFVNYLFKIQRLKKGILFMENKEAVRTGLVFSVLIMITMSASGIFIEHIDSDTGVTLWVIYTLVIINLCTLGIYFWWRHHTTALYQQRIKERDAENDIVEIADKDRQIKKLTESNDLLSKSVHRDNKLIPAMYNAVHDLLSHTEHSNTKSKGAAIRSELEEIMQERKDMLLQMQRDYKSLPSTKLERIDNVLKYMLLRAGENDIEFDFVLMGSTEDIVESIISKEKLETLLADLIENAIIATSHSGYRRILVTMGVVNDCFEITIQDTGIPFEIETLSNLGIKKHTTHADTGGSGVGYLTIFEILKERNASIIITEHVPENYAFSKSVKVRFDGKSEYIINSFRANELSVPIERENMFILR